MGCEKGSVNSMVNIKQWLGGGGLAVFAGICVEAITADLVCRQNDALQRNAFRIKARHYKLQVRLYQQPSATQLQQTFAVARRGHGMVSAFGGVLGQCYNVKCATSLFIPTASSADRKQ